MQVEWLTSLRLGDPGTWSNSLSSSTGGENHAFVADDVVPLTALPTYGFSTNGLTR